MAGFTGIICLNDQLPQSLTFRNKSPYGMDDRKLHTHLASDSYRFEQFTNDKFAPEKILMENDQYIIGTDGVLLNLPYLMQKTGAKDMFQLIISLYKSENKSFTKSLRGDFSGFILNKQNQSLFIFTNHIGSKRIFYHAGDKYFIFSSDVKEITHLMHQLHIDCKLDEQGAYLMLTNGFMVEEITLVKEVKRLMPGCYLSLQQNGNYQIDNYFHLRDIKKTTDNKDEIIQKMDDLFNQALTLEFEKDKAYNFKHIATLSGGLDSRMMVLGAHKLGYTDQLNFTFSQANYLDEKIAKQIAVDHGHHFLFQSLDGGNYLKKIDKSVFLNDGLILYSGSAHVLDSISNMNFNDYGLIHTGLVGDAVIGSFLSKPEIVAPSATDGMYSQKLSAKIKDTLNSVVEGYETEELYKFYSRGFLGAMNGNYTLDLVSQSVSPFLDVDFLSYCYSIPEEMKYKQKIYLDWIAAKHAEFARYPWEKTGVSPLKSNNYKKYFDVGYYKRMKLKFFDKLSGKIKSGMNPFDYWMQQNASLQAFVQQQWNENADQLSSYPKLKKDMEKLFSNGNTGEKFQVLTLLKAIQLHNLS